MTLETKLAEIDGRLHLFPSPKNEIECLQMLINSRDECNFLLALVREYREALSEVICCINEANDGPYKPLTYIPVMQARQKAREALARCEKLAGEK